MATNDVNPGPTLVAFVVGSLAGLAAGMLFAPKSGKENREFLKHKAQEGKHKAQEKLEEGKDKAKSTAAQAVETAKTVVSESKRAAQEAKDRVADEAA